MNFSNDLLNVGLIQPDLLWEDPEGNLVQLEKMVGGLPGETDLIILPETFSTGFTMRADRFAEEEGGMAHAWMLKVARERKAYVTGSLIVREQERVFNRLYWVSPEGVEGYYDKRHLFRMGREHTHFHPGDARKVFTLGSFRFMPQICYDLRFPVFARNRNDYDVILYVANWPAPRHHVWETLLRARAIENLACVIGVSRVGVDGEGVDHLGGSCVVDPMGRTEGTLDHRSGILNYTIDLKKIREFREKFPAWKDADMFSLG
ncbi:MAG: amidohydrolase [Bacteroidota bacterium]